MNAPSSFRLATLLFTVMLLTGARWSDAAEPQEVKPPTQKKALTPKAKSAAQKQAGAQKTKAVQKKAAAQKTKNSAQKKGAAQKGKRPPQKNAAAQKAKPVQTKAALAEEAAETEETTSGAMVCPVYPYMDFGSYCSYYALMYQTCMPTSYDSTNCNLPPGDCMTGNNCHPTSAVRSSHPGNLGYGGVRRARQASFPGPPTGSPVNVEAIDEFVIKFNVTKSVPIYAQIFIAKVTPQRGNANPGILARGTEITADSAGQVRHDYSDLTPGQDPFTRVVGRPHQLTFHYGQLDIDIITHRDTTRHGVE